MWIPRILCLIARVKQKLTHIAHSPNMSDATTNTPVSTPNPSADNTGTSTKSMPNLRPLSFTIQVASGGFILRQENYLADVWNQEVAVFTDKTSLLSAIQEALASI